jgi:ATP-binding cassette subfamily B protein
MKKQFPFYKQIDASDCGPTCLRIVSKYYGKSVPIEILRKKSYISKDGVSVSNIAYAAESIGFRTLGITTTYEKLAKEVPLP